MKYFTFITLSLLFACSSKDPKMCACLDSGEKLNTFSASMLTKEATAEDLAKMKELKSEKKTKCADFQTMSGEEMLKRKKMCEE